MTMAKTSDHAPGRVSRDLGRAAGGALLFALPMLMTMELWWLGFYLDRARLLILVITMLPVLLLLSHYIGINQTGGWGEKILDTFLALGVAAITCAVLLFLFGTLNWDSSIDEIIGKIVIQMIPASIGALLAKSQFGTERRDSVLREQDETYAGELFLMGVGALFLSFNLAPTEEMILISYQMTAWYALALVVLSLVLMHGFVFAAGFAGGSQVLPDEPRWSPFVRMTLPGYAIAFTTSLYMLWIFARTDGTSVEAVVMATVVLAFPAAIGAAAARLIL